LSLAEELAVLVCRLAVLLVAVVELEAY